MKPNWLDNTIGFFSPNAKNKRLAAKLKTEFMSKRKYEGAAVGRRTEGWTTSSSSANAEIEGGLTYLRNRSRDLRRNNPYFNKAIRVITSNVIGTGIKTRVSSTSKSKTKRFAEHWKQWAMTNAIDFEGRKNFHAIQNLICDSVVESGEVLIRRRKVVPTSQNPLPFQLQVLEPDFLDSTRISFKLPNGNDVIQGIEFDSTGKRVAYHLFEEHPGASNTTNFSSLFKTIIIPSEDILHVFIEERPGQIRGVPWGAPIMLRLRDLDEFEDAQLIRQKIAACFTAFVHDMEIDPNLSDDDSEELGDKMEPGLIEFLGAGKDIKFANPPGVTGYGEFLSSHLHAIAGGMGISYESLTGDLSQVNFSSARMGWLEMHRNIETWRKNLMIPQLIDPVFNWFLEGMALIGQNPNGVESVSIPPKREMIDPAKELQAEVKEIRSGLKTLDEAILERGKDPDTHLAQIKLDNIKIDELELILDIDPRNIGKDGDLQVEPIEDSKNENNENS